MLKPLAEIEAACTIGACAARVQSFIKESGL